MHFIEIISISEVQLTFEVWPRNLEMETFRFASIRNVSADWCLQK